MPPDAPLRSNWLRVSDTAERSQVDQRRGQHLHARVPVLEAFTAEHQPLALVLPRPGACDPPPSRLADGVEPPLAATRGRLAVARLLWEVGAQARLAEALPLGRGSPAALAVASGAWEVPPALLRAPVQGLQALRAPTQVARMARSPGDGSADRPRVVHQGDAVVAWLRLVAGRADTITPCVAPVGGPSPWRTRRSSGCAAASGRPRALPARQSDPAAAPVAQTGSRVGSGRAGVPSGSGGPGRPCHGLPGSRPPSMRGKTRSEPRVHCGPRAGRHEPGRALVCGPWPGHRG